MRFMVAGIKNGKSCIVEERDLAPQSEDVSAVTLIDLPAASLPPRPAGKGPLIDMGLPAGTARWMRVRFRANQTLPIHHTDTIDCFTVVAGTCELILDDGPHRLSVGDSAMVKGVDHGWKTGAEECFITTVVLGTPAH